jgi:ABC-type molybdate transport system substrate-binding protein
MTEPLASPSPSLSLFSALAVQGPLQEVVLPAYQASGGVPVKATFEPTTVLMRRIEEGTYPDVIIAVSGSVDELAARGLVEPGSAVPVARAGLGVATVQGASVDLGTTETFVQSLLAARSVAYSRSGASGIFFAGLLHDLGIAEQVNARATIIEKGYTASALLDGRADLAVQQLSELMFVRGASIAGPFPASLQHYTRFSVARRSGSDEAGPAAELIRQLCAGPARDAFAASGLEPP